MNSGSATVIFSSGTSARRARRSALMSASPRSRSNFLLVRTRSVARSGSLSTPTVEKIWRTSASCRTMASTVDT